MVIAMKVQLLSYTKDAERLCAAAGKGGRMKNRVAPFAIAVLLLSLAPCFRAFAADDFKPKHIRQRPPTEMTVTGKVVKNVWNDKEGGMRVNYTMMTQTGEKIYLSTGNRMEDGQPTQSQLDKFTGNEILFCA